MIFTNKTLTSSVSNDITQDNDFINLNTSEKFEIEFSLMFRYEGIYKIQPEISNLLKNKLPYTLLDEDIFIPTVSFNVLTKLA